LIEDGFFSGIALTSTTSTPFFITKGTKSFFSSSVTSSSLSSSILISSSFLRASSLSSFFILSISSSPKEGFFSSSTGFISFNIGAGCTPNSVLAPMLFLAE
jgi:hypothetical protein